MKKPIMKKSMAYMKNNQDGGGNQPAAGKQLMKNQSVAAKYGSPMYKSDKRIAEDYARNAEADGNTSAGRYEAKEAVKEAAMKKGTPMHKYGAMKGDQSASKSDYANYKGTDKGYHGDTGSSHGDQSSSRPDYIQRATRNSR